jgi:hypothetical protein
MKKNIFLLVILLIINMQPFADENLIELESINSIRPLFTYRIENAELNLLGLNPLFFNTWHYGLSLNVYEKYKSIFQNNITQNEQNIYQTSQANNWIGFLIVMAGYSILWTDAYTNPLRYRYWENAWERHGERFIKENELEG